MKKIKRAVLILLFVSTVMMAAFTGWDLAVRDRRAPEIRLPETALCGPAPPDPSP